MMDKSAVYCTYGQRRRLWSVLLEDHHAEERYAAENYPIHGKNDYTENLVIDVVSTLDQ